MVAPPPTQLVARLLPHPPNPSQTTPPVWGCCIVFKSRYPPPNSSPNPTTRTEHAQCMYNRLSSMLQT